MSDGEVTSNVTPARPESESSVRLINRSARLLRAVAAKGNVGAMLVDLAKESDLGNGTTHRLLNALSDVGFVFQDLATRRYRLGSALAALSRQSSLYEISAAGQPCLERLASESGDTVYLSVAEGMAAVCVARISGAFPIRTLTLDLGDRRPLGVGAGALALLAALPTAWAEKAIEGNDAWYRQFPGYSTTRVRELVERTRHEGFALNAGMVIPAMAAIGIAVRDTEGRSVAALSIASITERIMGQRMESLKSALTRESKVLGARMSVT